jgi:hypothetical protein
MTAGLPPRRAAWGAAMRAELAAIDDPDERRRFARSAAAAAFVHGFGLRLAFALGAGVVVAAVTLVASRIQLDDGGPGVLGVTVLVPPLLLFAVALISARATRSFRFGLETGYLAMAVAFLAVSSVLAVEGLVWMDRQGVFMLDGDPPRQVVGDVDVMLDLFTTGMWIGHVLFWSPWPAIGAAMGRALAGARSAADAPHARACGRARER